MEKAEGKSPLEITIQKCLEEARVAEAELQESISNDPVKALVEDFGRLYLESKDSLLGTKGMDTYEGLARYLHENSFDYDTAHRVYQYIQLWFYGLMDDVKKAKESANPDQSNDKDYEFLLGELETHSKIVPYTAKDFFLEYIDRQIGKLTLGEKLIQVNRMLRVRGVGIRPFYKAALEEKKAKIEAEIAEIKNEHLIKEEIKGLLTEAVEPEAVEPEELFFQGAALSNLYKFTIFQKVNAILYLLKVSGVNFSANANKSEISRLIYAITEKNDKTIYDLVRNNGKNIKSSTEKRKNGLLRLKEIFRKLRSNVATAIDNDITNNNF
jgi:hypothetical protein